MKILSGFVLVGAILLSVFFTATSCAKKATPAPTPAPTNTTPTYTFNAMGITASGVQYTISNPNAGPLVITGTTATSNINSTDQTVKITINSAVNSIGSYTLSSSTSNTGVYTSGSNSFTYSTNTSPNVGTLNITKIDMTNKIMSASFSFTAQQILPTVGNSGAIYGSFTNVAFN